MEDVFRHIEEHQQQAIHDLIVATVIVPLTQGARLVDCGRGQGAKMATWIVAGECRPGGRGAHSTRNCVYWAQLIVLGWPAFSHLCVRRRHSPYRNWHHVVLCYKFSFGQDWRR